METRIEVYVKSKEKEKEKKEAVEFETGVYSVQIPNGGRRILVVHKLSPAIHVIDDAGRIYDIPKQDANLFYPSIKKVDKLTIIAEVEE